MKDGSESRPGDLVLTRWSIIIRDWLGSDTLRGMSGDGEMLFVRLCLDQMEKGVARADKALWKRAHGGRCHDFDAAWAEATATFTVTENGLVHERVRRDRERAIAEITAKANGARNDIATRPRDANGRLMPKNTPGQHQDTWRSPQGEHQVSPSSASASASASTEHRGKNQKAASPPAARSARAVSVPREPSGPVQVMISLWQRAYLEIVGEPYVLHPGDAPAVAAFVKRARPEPSPRAVWDHACWLLGAQDAFWLTNRNLRTLATRWSDVVGIPEADRARSTRPWKTDYEEGLGNILAAQMQDQNSNGVHAPKGQEPDAISGRTGPTLFGTGEAQRRLPSAQAPGAHNGHAPRPDEGLPRGRGGAGHHGPHRIGPGIGQILGAVSGGGDDRRAEAGG